MSRDGNGNYTPPLNPVVGGQPIEADWANDTINDLAAALTDSLSRSGNGGMLASFRAVDGTVNIPAISFNNETNSGIYRAGTGDYRLCVNGKDKARIRDVNGMAAFQVFDLAGTGAWETLATSAEVGAITLADVLAVGNTTGGTDIVVGDGDSIVFNAYIDDFCSIESNIVGPATNLDFQLGDDDGDAFRFRFDHFSAGGGYLDALKIKPDVNVVARDKFIVDVTGTVDCEGLRMDDSEYARFGDSGDLQIFHSGVHSYIQDQGTGILSIQSNGDSITFHDSANTRNMAQFNTGGTALLSWAGGTGTGVKLATTATGIDVTGTVEANGFSGTGTVTITDFIDDDSFATASATNVPTAESVKAYVDTAGGNETLAETLALGNTTGATDIEMTDGAEITSSQQNGISLNSTSGFRVVSGSSGPFSMGQGGTNIGITNIVGIPGLPAGSLLLATGQGSPTASAMICNGTDVKFYDNIRLNSSSVNILSDGDIITKHDADDETALQSSGGMHRVQATETFAALYFGADAATAAAKIQTSDTGVTVTGTVTADGVSLGDDDRIVLGAGSDLQIYHAASLGGTNYIIAGSGTPSLTIGAGTGGLINLSVSGGTVAVIDADGLRTNSGVISSQAGYDVIVQAAVGYGVNLTSSGGFSRVSATETQAQLFYGVDAATSAKKLETVDTGVDITGDLDVTGTITSNAFAYSKATVNNAADILYTAFNSFAGKRIINTASATATTYGLPTPVAADIGKSWIICNPTDSEITIDHDASGTANYIWIMDGVTLSAAASSWTIKKGAVVEIVVAAAAAGGGSSTAPNYLIFGAGLLEIV